MDHPARATTMQTLGGIFRDVDDVGIQTLTLQGNTGWRYRTKYGMDGLKTAAFLYNSIYKEYFTRVKASSGVELLLINGVDQYTYSISPDDFQMMRSKSDPLLFQYTLQMTTIQDVSMATAPAADPVKEIVGNIKSVLATAAATATTTQTSTKQYYVVVSGDTLSGIALKFYGNGGATYYNQIAQANHISDPNLIYVGQVLVIPPIAA